MSECPPRQASVDELVSYLVAAVDRHASAESFLRAFSQAHLIDLSNRDAHRIGRAVALFPDEELLDIETLRREGRQNEAGLGPGTRNHPYYGVEHDVVFGSGPVTIYRGVPRGVTAIDIGDFVALDPAYAAASGATNNHDWQVVSLTVPATDVVFGTNDAKEWTYSPRALRQRVGSLVGFWQAQQEPRAA